jgi:uncharacterized protein with von Willebrand factor type A (vWA) domain
MSGAGFKVETVWLDLPATVGAFARRLHAGGVPMTPARSADLAHALDLVRPVSRRRLYWTARAIAVTDPTQVKAFDAVFAAVFGVTPPRDEHQAPPPTAHDGVAPGEGRSSERVVDVPVPLPSDDEVLAEKRFDALEPDELARLYQLMSRLRLETPRRRTRRYEHGRGDRLDMRRTLRRSLRTAGEPVRLSHRRRRVQRRRLVLLCDISGSMEPYARAYLQFLTSAAGSDRRAEAFAFATRLTRLTRALASRNPERAIQRAAETAPDWSSGTRIGHALKAFNDRHGRRGLARGAVVVIISDGWERGDPALVGREMERLARLAHRIVWVNPRVSATRFSVQTGGMVAALPHCDALVSGHSFNALGEVVAAIGGADFEPPASEEPEESWASATPVAGSSVAMPSGYGPKRGRTTPGWPDRPSSAGDES